MNRRLFTHVAIALAALGAGSMALAQNKVVTGRRHSGGDPRLHRRHRLVGQPGQERSRERNTRT